MRANVKILCRPWILIAAAASASVLPAAADACRIFVRPNLDDVRFADVVVVGRVANYRIIRDQAFRDRMLASPKLPADMRKFYQDPRGKLLPDYARFDVRVDEVLAGRAGRTLSVTWDNSTFSEPDTMPAGPYLIALRRPGSPVPPLRGPSGTIFPAPDKHALALLQAPCSIPFLYEVASDQARAIRGLIKSRRAR